MTNKNNSSDTFLSQVELELLEVLLAPDDAPYPWNPADEDSEAYFDELERQFATQDWLDEELTSKSPAFYEQLDSLWSQVSTCSHDICEVNQSVVENLQLTLHTTFAHGVPQGWLSAIAHKAAEIFTSQKSMGEQLVQCVQAVLPTWGAEDLFVLARPFAYAMRSSESQDVKSIVNNIENRDWKTLSEIEQAKVSVAIAYYAFKQLNRSQSQD